MKIIIFFVSFLILFISWSTAIPSYFESECNLGCNITQCCTLGYERFSFPQCSPLGNEGDHCYPEDINEPEDLLLSYPNGLNILATNVYRFFCPCEDHLVCIDNTCVLRNLI